MAFEVLLYVVECTGDYVPVHSLVPLGEGP